MTEWHSFRQLYGITSCKNPLKDVGWNVDWGSTSQLWQPIVNLHLWRWCCFYTFYVNFVSFNPSGLSELSSKIWKSQKMKTKRKRKLINLINLWHFQFSKNTFRFFKLSLQLEGRLSGMSSSKSSVQVAEEHSSFAVILRLHGTGPAGLFFDTKKWWISKVDLYALSFFSWWIAMIAIAIDWNFPFWKMM